VGVPTRDRLYRIPLELSKRRQVGEFDLQVSQVIYSGLPKIGHILVVSLAT